ncbi:MAG: VTT domain-containing protein [Chloroflexi bacterium]|nr:VTT domain-containing protein [Chloroflexota bacterium]
MKKSWQTNVVRALVFVFVIALSIYLYTIRDQVQELEGYGYPGIFLVSFLTNATLILPLPGVVIASLMGTVFHPFWVAIAAGSGAALGELSGYLAGFSGQGVAEKTPIYNRMEELMRKYGVWAVLILAFIPNPLFDMAGIIAGILRMPLRTFLIWTWLGKVLKMLVFAYGGATISRFFPF